MCATCGCGDPKNKHGMKSVKAANKKFDKKDLSPKQKALAGKADPKGKITGADFKALKKKSGKK